MPRTEATVRGKQSRECLENMQRVVCCGCIGWCSIFVLSSVFRPLLETVCAISSVFNTALVRLPILIHVEYLREAWVLKSTESAT